RVLLRLVEPVPLVHKHNRSRPAPRSLLRLRHYFFNLFDPAQHRAERHKLAPRQPRDQPRQRCFPAPRRPPKQHRTQIVAFDLYPQRLARSQQLFLPDKLIERPRTHPLRQRLQSRRRFRLHRLARATRGSWQFRKQAHDFVGPYVKPGSPVPLFRTGRVSAISALPTLPAAAPLGPVLYEFTARHPRPALRAAACLPQASLTPPSCLRICRAGLLFTLGVEGSRAARIFNRGLTNVRAPAILSAPSARRISTTAS